MDTKLLQSTINGTSIPNNINPLSPNGFILSITRLPKIKFWCQVVNIPGISLGSPEQQTPLSTFPIPGDMLSYDNLTIQFLIDEYMCNYKSIVDWMRGLGFPEDNQEYIDMLADSQNPGSELSKNFSDATLQIMDSSNNPCKTIYFKDLFPISIDGLQFESTSTDVNYLVGTATFRYTTWEFGTDVCCPADYL
jgi:hypothetical protein